MLNDDARFIVLGTDKDTTHWKYQHINNPKRLNDTKKTLMDSI